MRNKYIIIKLWKRKPKTEVYQIINISTQVRIAVIKWYPQWRQYCLMPIHGTTWNTDCLQLIQEFMIILNKKHKEKLTLEKKT